MMRLYLLLIGGLLLWIGRQQHTATLLPNGEVLVIYQVLAAAVGLPRGSSRQGKGLLYQEPTKQPLSYRGEHRLLRIIAGVFHKPPPNIAGMTGRKRLIGSVAAIMLQAIALAIFFHSAIGGVFVQPVALSLLTLLLEAISAFFFTLIGIVVASGVYQALCRLLGGQGFYGGLFAGLAFAGLPVIAMVPFGLLGVLMAFLEAIPKLRSRE